VSQVTTGREQVLAGAMQCVMRDRNATHGDPEDNFRDIAEFWTTYLRGRFPGVSLASYDVAAMMALVKISRITTSPAQMDHWVDVAGYAACGGEVATRGDNDV
jgi:hypothetical protein